MARKNSATMQEELYAPEVDRPPTDPARQELGDACLIDLDVDESSPFLRAQKRIPARRSSLPKKTAHGLLWATGLAAALCVAGLVAAALYSYGEHSWRFRVQSSDEIEITGMQNVTRAQVMEVMGADIGRNIFFIPLAQQKAQLEQIPWVESSSVMRFVPNRLKVEIHERTPVAFARIGPRIALIDAGGTLMELPRNHKYSFLAILGMNPGEPLSTRAPRMKAYNELVRALDAGGAHYSQDLSEVDLSDLDDLKVRVNDPAGDVLVELGSSDYLKRYRTYVTHVQQWRQQFQKLESVNLRYDNQVIVNPDLQAKPKPPVVQAPVVKAAAAAAAVKPAALVTKIDPHDRTVPKPAFELSQQTLDPKAAAAKKAAAPAKPKKPAAKAGRVATAKRVSARAWKKSGSRPGGPKPNAGKPQAKKAAQATPAVVGPPKPSPAIGKQAGGGGQ